MEHNQGQQNDVDMEAILDVMGCKTRRDIMDLLREEPRFVSEISQELQIGEDVGILTSSTKKVVRGRPRKYYDMPNDVNVHITITKNSFNVSFSEDLLNPHNDIKQLPSGDEWSKLLDIEKRIDQGHTEAIEELKAQIRLYDNLKERAEYILERTYNRY